MTKISYVAKVTRLKDLSTRYKHFVYYLEHLAQEFQLFQDESDYEAAQGDIEGVLKASDKFLKHTYLYRCLLECRVTLPVVEEYIQIINTKILQVQELLDKALDRETDNMSIGTPEIQI